MVFCPLPQFVQHSLNDRSHQGELTLSGRRSCSGGIFDHDRDQSASKGLEWYLCTMTLLRVFVAILPAALVYGRFRRATMPSSHLVPDDAYPRRTSRNDVQDDVDLHLSFVATMSGINSGE